MSSRYFSLGWIRCSIISSSDSLGARFSNQSQPGRESAETRLANLCALPKTLSLSTRIAPPRSRFVSTPGKSRYPVTSASAVGSPVTSTGRFFATSLTSSGFDGNCRWEMRLYKSTSSTYLSTFSVEGL